MSRKSRKTNEELLANHGIDTVIYHHVRSKVLDRNAFTLCILSRKDDQKVIARGVALCSLLDQYNKSTGRKIAFERACYALRHQGRQLQVSRRDRPSRVIKAGGKVMEVPVDFSSVVYLANYGVSGCGFKSEYLPTPGNFDKEILKNAFKIKNEEDSRV